MYVCAPRCGQTKEFEIAREKNDDDENTLYFSCTMCQEKYIHAVQVHTLSQSNNVSTSCTAKQ